LQSEAVDLFAGAERELDHAAAGGALALDGRERGGVDLGELLKGVGERGNEAVGDGGEALGDADGGAPDAGEDLLPARRLERRVKLRVLRRRGLGDSGLRGKQRGKPGGGSGCRQAHGEGAAGDFEFVAHSLTPD